MTKTGRESNNDNALIFSDLILFSHQIAYTKAYFKRKQQMTILYADFASQFYIAESK